MCLWRPFHICFVRLRRGWDTKSDITDVFATFFLLSYSRCMHQSLLLVYSTWIRSTDKLGSHFDTYHLHVDSSISFGDTTYLLFAIPLLSLSLMLIILPPLLLTLYPIKAFRLCLSKCRFNVTGVSIFVDKVHGCYRNGLDSGRDMRSFSGFYFLLRVLAYFTPILSFKIERMNECYSLGTIFLSSALIIALIKPYKKMYMNYLDTILLSNIALMCYTLSSGFCVLLMARGLLLSPIIIFIVMICLKKFHDISKLHMCNVKVLLQRCYECCRLRRAQLSSEPIQSSTADIPTAAQPLVQPTCTVISYGGNDNGAIAVD